MKVRLYHLAAEWELPATAILETLHEAGHRDLKNQFVEIDEHDILGLKDLLYDAGHFGDEDEGDEAEGIEATEIEGEDAETTETSEDATEGESGEAEAAAESDTATATAEPEEGTAAQTEDPPKEPSAEKPALAEAPETKPVEEPQAAAEPKAEETKPVEAKQEPQTTTETKKSEPAKPAKPAKPKPPKKPAKKSLIPGAPAGVAAGFRGFAPGFDPNARRSRRTSSRGGSEGGEDSGARGARGANGRVEMVSGPIDPNARKRAGARGAAASANKRQRTAARRPGAHGGQGRGRRLERRMQEMDRWRKASRKPRRPKSRSSKHVVRPDAVSIQQPISLKDLSAELAIRVNELIAFLMRNRMMINVNQPVPKDAIEMIGLNWNIDIKVLDEILAEDTVTEMDQEEDVDKDLEPRKPVVAVLGHVDHGKTSLLDYIRSTKKKQVKVAAGEAGGITQHIGAYVATHNGKDITFIDTPGHAAFTEMRARGANVTDMVLLVVAADDGVMPQTKEAIQHAQAANVQILVAANKIDKKGVTKDKVLTGLSQIDGMLPSEYGGEIDVIPCSAHTGQGVDDLLENVLTYAEVLELKANPKKAARGTVLEAKKTEGRGILVTLLVEDGTLKKGDTIVCGKTGGKIRRMNDDMGKQLKKAGPATPVEVVGIDDVPEAGDRFYVVTDKEAKNIVAERKEKALKEKASTGLDHIPTSQAEIWDLMREAEKKEVLVVLKADVSGSLQVLKRELSNLTTDEVKCRVIRDGVGGISQADVLLAAASEAVVIGFGVTADNQARKVAKMRDVHIHTHRVIYELLDGVKEIMAGQLDPDEVEHVIGSVSVRKVFKSSKVGNIAGCFVDDGIVKRNAQIRLARDGIILWQGPMDSLRRFSEDVKEVRENFECGIKLRGYEDVREGDVFEVVEIEEVARTLD